jgi:hypothetical protein
LPIPKVIVALEPSKTTIERNWFFHEAEILNWPFQACPFTVAVMAARPACDAAGIDAAAAKVTLNVPSVTVLFPLADVPGMGTRLKEKVPDAPVEVREVIVTLPLPPTRLACQVAEPTVQLALAAGEGRVAW